MRKIVGLIPLYDDERESYWMIPGYMKMLEAWDAIPLMLPLIDNHDELDYFVETCGGFVLTGGHDVAPELYNAVRQPYCGTSCKLRDEMERYILKKSVELDKPVLGICRGVQFMNACFGGTLYQDLDKEFNSSIDHHMTPPYDRAVHEVNIRRDSLLYSILGKEKIGVNSYHHQAVKDLSPEFANSAISEDGIVEGIEMPSKRFIVGVQWHPELTYLRDENSQKLIKAFVDAI